MRRVLSSRPVFQGPFGLVLSHSVLFVLALGLVSSALTAALVRRTVLRDEEQRFEMARQEAEHLIRSRLETFGSVLRHTRAFLVSRDRVSRRDFRSFIQSVDLPNVFPDLLAVAFTERVVRRDLEAHLRDVREDGYAHYHIWPARTTGAREFFPVKYVEPFVASNRRALGFDIYTDPVRAGAMDVSRDSGEPALSGIITLVRDDHAKTPPAGFLLFLPIYQRGMGVETPAGRRRALLGFVQAVFRADDLFRVIRHASPLFRQGVGMRVSMGGVSLFDTGEAQTGTFYARRALALPGQTWTVETYSTPDFASSADRYAPIYVFFTGLLITLLASWVAFMADRHARGQRDAIELRDEFLSICSHELRTPLTSMKLQNQLVQRTLQADLAAGNTARFEKMVRQSGQQIDRLVRLVEEMLDISRIRSGKLAVDPEAVDLCQVVHDTIERFGPQIQAAGCALRVEVPETLPGNWDRLRLEQVLVNLLSNALKYGPGKPIQVALARDGDKAVLTVRDEGIGIAPEHQARIFERFERAPSRKEIGGLGLGLYIAKQILELQGGSIRVESEVGMGSSFVVELPAGGGEIR